MNALKLILLLIVFPLLLAAIGGWELQRAVDGALTLSEFEANLEIARPQLRELVAQNPMTPVTVNGEKLSAQLVLSRMDKAADETGTAHRVNIALQRLAKWVISMSLLAALIGAAALGATHWAGAQARKSRQALLQVFSLGSRLLPYVLVGQAIALAATVALLLAYEGLGFWHIGRLSTGEVKIMAVIGVIAAFCLYSMWLLLRQLRWMLTMFEPTPISMFGQVVSSQQAPGLWRHVNELANTLGALPADHIVVSLTEGFYVTSSDATVLPAETALRGRTLHLPLLYLGVLSREEIVAVIGHELAHFVGEDTEYSMRFLPIYDGVNRSLGALAQAMLASDGIQGRLMRPSFLFGVFFMKRFHHAVSHWSRQRELIADATGSRLAGNAAAASALVRVSAINPQVDRLLRAHLDARHAAIDDLPAAVLHELQQCELELPPQALEIHLPHPTDSHPSNGERIQALHVTPEDAVRSGTRSVDGLAAGVALDAYFSEPLVLRQQLSRDLKAEVAWQEEAHAQVLESLAESVKGEQSLHEGGRRRAVVTGVLALPFIALGLWMMTRPWLAPEKVKGTPLSTLGAGAAVAGFALIFLWLAIRRFKRAPQTALRLTPEHFVFANLAQPLPIEHIARVGLQAINGLWVIVQLSPEAPMPEIRKSAFGVPGAKLNKKKHQVLLFMAQFCIDNKRLTSQATLELIYDYLNAAHARQALQERQE